MQAAEAAVRQAEMNLGYTKITAPIDGIVGIATAHVGDLVGPGTGPRTTISQSIPIKTVVNIGEQSFTEFITDHPDRDERNVIGKDSNSTDAADGNLYPHKGKFCRGSEPRHKDRLDPHGVYAFPIREPLTAGPVWEVRAVVKLQKALWSFRNRQ